MTLFLDGRPAGPPPPASLRTLTDLRRALESGEPVPLPDRRAVRLATRLALRGEAVVYGPLPDRRAWAVRADSPWRWSWSAGCWFRDLRRRA
ncbi:MAG TPA: hypothetical protein VIL18_01130 [Longimicrobiales bacterium]